MNKPKILVKITLSNGRVKKATGRKRRRITVFIKANNFEIKTIEIRVDYGNGLFNCGIYKTRDESICALRAFLDVYKSDLNDN